MIVQLYKVVQKLIVLETTARVIIGRSSRTRIMGAGASTALPDEIDLAHAQSFAGDKFDEAKFNSAAVDGKVSKDAFLKVATAAPSLAE